jgi:uncharacterized protein
MEHNEWLKSILKAREEREKRLLDGPRNWFSLAGLFWLEEGDNSFGGAEGNKVMLVGLPEKCGNLYLQNGKVVLSEAIPGLLLNGKPAECRELHSDADGEPDLLEIGSFSLMVIKRGEFFLLRTRDNEAKTLKNFHGLNYFPPDPQYRVQARFIPYDPPRNITVSNAIGLQEESRVLGKLLFTLQRYVLELEVEEAGEEGLVNFVDECKTDSTYPGGRWLTLPLPLKEEVTLDFNLAGNWPCAYTPWATCPLPPQNNRLYIRVEAGEKRYHD